MPKPKKYTCSTCKGERICIKCSGSGNVTDHGAGVITLGLGYLMGAKTICPKCNGVKTCNSCKGKGFIWRE